MQKLHLLLALFATVIISLTPSCKVSYSFTGANLSPDVKTYAVYYFPNRARLVNATLAQTFTEELRDKLQRQTSLDEVSENGDIEFEGQITGYDFKPMAIEAGDASAQTRLTITVKLKYTNHKSPDDDLEKTFSAYEDYDSSQSLSSVEDELVDAIVDDLVEDIFNATIASW